MNQETESMTVQKGMRIPRSFTKEGINPFDQFTYEKRSSTIKNPDGSIVFHMEEVEVPSFWTQVATDILAQKYFRKAGVPLKNKHGEPLMDENGKVITGSETSIKQVAHRIAGCWRQWGEQYGYFASPEDAQIFYEEMAYMIIAQVAAPNSPQWFTTGLNWAYGINGPAQGHSYVDPVTKKVEYSKDAYTRSVPHACFIQSIKDDLVTEGGIFSLLTREARVFKYGSGCTGARSYVWTTFCGLEQMEKLWKRMEIKYPVHADSEYASYIEPAEPIYTLALQQDGAFVKDKINQIWRFTIKPADKLRIKTTYGAEALVSSWHPCMILEQGNIVERRSDELKRGDLLIVPNKTVEEAWPWQDNYLLSYNYEHFGKIKEATVEVDSEIGWLVGYFIGDGSIGWGNYQRHRTGTRRLRVRFYDETRENLERVQDIMQRRFGLRASIRLNAPEKSKALELTITQGKATGLFHHFCPAGPKTYSAQLPHWIFKSPIAVLRAVVAGLLDSDGTVSADNDTVRAMFSTASPTLAEQLQALVSYLGWTTTQVSVQSPTDRTQAITLLARNTRVEIKQAIAAEMSHPARRERLATVKVKESKTGSWRRDGVSWTSLGLDKIIADKNLGCFLVGFPSSLRYIIGGKKFCLAPARSQNRIGKGRASSFLQAVLPYLIPENKRCAERLLRVLEGVAEVSVVESAASDTAPFYDFTTAQHHTYLAGERGMLTIHNTGSNFSNLRGKGERLSGGGTSSGLMSFLKIFDTAAGSVKSGGTTRRAAKMVCLDLDHPEIENFIWWKVREEEKVASLVAGSKIMKQRLDKLVAAAKNHPHPLEDKFIRKLIKQAAQQNIPLNYIVRAIDLAKQGQDFPLREFDTHYESEAYQTVSGQNSNNSIRIPNSFFEALHTGREWQLKSRTSGEVTKTISAKKLWDDVAYCAWASADPGVQFDSTINEWHTCPEDGRINASNPCSEYLFLDDTACNLASINLLKCFDDETGTFDLPRYRHTIRLWTIALEISVLMAQFPSEEIARRSYLYRTLGLGFANLGTLLMVQGIPYDSEKGRAIAGSLAAIMTGDSYATSAELASVLGPFERYEANKEAMLRVIRNHRQAAYDEERYEELTIKPLAINQEVCPAELRRAAQDAWDKALAEGEKYGYRNAQVSVIAPTGTIGLVMSCDTTGVEPDYSLVKFKKLAGGGYFKIINDSVPLALRRLGYTESQIKDIINYCRGQATLNGSPYINRESLKEQGFNDQQLAAIEKQLSSAMDIRFAFTPYILGDDFYNRIMSKVYNKTMNKTKGIGSKPDSSTSSDDLLSVLGFTEEQINAANEYICGTMTLEGAPHLKEEHLPIFDCANRCGKKGQRYIHPYGHLKMLAAVQSFISGAISKTINMPPHWTVEQIQKAYYDAWTMMIKAVALYRDGSKLSQPLNATLEQNPELKAALEMALDEEEKGQSSLVEVHKKVLLGQRELHLSGVEENGRLLKLQAAMTGMSPAQESMLTALVNMVNMGLSSGMNVAVLSQSLAVEGHPVVQELRAFLQQYERGHSTTVIAQQTAGPSLSRAVSVASITTNLITPSLERKMTVTTADSQSEKVKCSGCGATQLRPNGSCLLCEVCGETSGCS